MNIVQAFAEVLVNTTAKATLLLILACIAVRLLKRSSAAMRHSLLSLTMCSLILLPVFSWALPTLSLPILPATERPENVVISGQTAPRPLVETPTRATDPELRHDSSLVETETSDGSNVGQPPQTLNASDQAVVRNRNTAQASVDVSLASSTRTSDIGPASTRFDLAALTFVLIWVVGASLFVTTLLAGVVRVARLRWQAEPVADGTWMQLLETLRPRMSLRGEVELREHAEAIVPLTCGVFRPAILFPRLARDWHESMQQSVLTHELAHVQRRDVLFQLIGRLACTLFWFHPLAWFAMRRLRQEGEHACDDAVVCCGEKASDYAEQLLHVARLCRAANGMSPGVAMAEGSHLEVRVKSLFDSSQCHGPARRAAVVAMLLVCGSTLGVIAAADPIASADRTAQPEASQQTDSATTVTTAASRIRHIPKWRHGTEALERIIELNPVFGPERQGLTLGLAYATPQRVFSAGDRLPVELFLMNVSDREVTTQFRINFLFNTPLVETSSGDRVEIPRLETFMARPLHKVTLKPGEACAIPAIGLGLAMSDPVSFESPPAGEYRVSYMLAGHTSGALQFKVSLDSTNDLQINTIGTNVAGIATRERMQILKPVFGAARRGVETGLAFSTRRSTYVIGETIPVDLFVRNVGDRKVTIGFHPDLYWSPLNVVDSNDREVPIEPLRHWMFEPALAVTLDPGQAYSLPTPGLWLRQRPGPLCFVPPDIGTYRIKLSRTISGNAGDQDSWIEDLTTGPLPFHVVSDKDGQSAIQLLTANNNQPVPENPTDKATENSEDSPAASDSSDDSESKIDLSEVIWWERVEGLQAGFLLDSPTAPNQRVPDDSFVKYRILIRNTTDRDVTFMSRPVPFDYRDTPYLIPSDKITEAMDAKELPERFRASGGRQGWKYDLAYEITLRPGESTIVPGHRGGDELGLYVGKGDAKDWPAVVEFRPGMNWIVQPLEIWLSTSPDYGTGALFEGLYFQSRVDDQGRIKSEPATRCEIGKGARTLRPRIQLEVGTLNAGSARNAKQADWGKVDKGLQCGIRLLNPRSSYRIGDTLEAELLWRNTSNATILSPRPRKLDLYPMLHDTDGRFLPIDFGARFRILPVSLEFQPGEVCSLGVFRITLVKEGTQSPRSNAEPAHITLQPGTYYLSGSGGVSAPEGGNPRSARIEFDVATHEP